VGSTLGALLLAAAYLKFRDLTWEPFGKALLIPPGLRIIFIEADAILGIWLVLGIARRMLWTISILYFTALACVSIFLVIRGEPTCGCFGKATINPWLIFGVDAAAIAGLAVTYPRLRTARIGRGDGRRGAWPIARWAVIALLIVVTVQVVRAGGFAPAWHALIAQNVAVEPALAELGSGPPGKSADFGVTLHNENPYPVRIIGGSDDCGANATMDLPQTIAPGESCVLLVRGYFKGNPGRFIREYFFLTDHDTPSIVIGRYAGRVLPKE
jgi:hypothetical protein